MVSNTRNVSITPWAVIEVCSIFYIPDMGGRSWLEHRQLVR